MLKSPHPNMTFTLYVPINMQHFWSIGQMLLEILSGNKNPRWLPGRHIRFWIRSKSTTDIRLICSNKCAKFHMNCLNASWDIARKWKSKMAAWRPYWISNWLQNVIYFCLICTNKCAKFHINCLNASWDIALKWKSKMATWRPYWISNWLQIENLPFSNMYQ